MIVELLGPYGSGKSTIVNTLSARQQVGARELVCAEELRGYERQFGWPGLKKCKGLAWVRRILPLYLRYPTISIPLLIIMLMQGRPFRGRYVNRALVTFSFCYRVQLLCRGRVAVLDEGFLQGLFGIFVGSHAFRGVKTAKFVLNRYNRLVSPKGVVLRLDPSTVRKRVFGRVSKGRFNTNSSTERRRHFEAALQLHEHLLNLAPEGMLKSKVDATGDQETLRRNVLAAVTLLLEPSKEIGGFPARA